MAVAPRYPIYVPSKGRPDICYTARFLIRDDVPFRLVVESQERELYAARFGAQRLLVLPFSNMGSVIPARNWIKEHATAEGHERHWQLDDNMMWVSRWYKGKRIRCDANIGLAAVEDFVDRYENVALAGLNYEFTAVQGRGQQPRQPFWLNNHVYSCTLVLNSLPHKWRGTYNEDTDICLQVLADGWCTVLVNAFMVKKIRTMILAGGNTGMYQGDGRLRMARSLERVWPGVVKTTRRWGRAQHIVADEWKRFDTSLKLKPGVDPASFDSSKYSIRLVPQGPVKSERLKKLLADQSQ